MRENSPSSSFEMHPKVVRQAYDQAYRETDRLRDTEASYRWVLKKLGVTPGSYLLDIAFGLGILLKEAQRKDLQLFGIEISSTAVEIVKKAVPDARLCLANGEFLPFEEKSFDYVTNLGSLEHFLKPAVGVREIARVLKTNGKAAILLPNGYYLPDLILKVGLKGYGPSHHQVVERFAAVNEWRDFLEENGLSVLNIYRYNFKLPQTVGDWEWFLKHPKKLIPPIVGFFIPFNFSFSFLYICEARETKK